MGLDASQFLGAPQLAAVKVNPPGLGKTVMARTMHTQVGTGLAAVAVSALADAAVQTRLQRSAQQQRDAAAESSAPSFAKIALLAVTSGEIALIQVDARTTLKLTGVVLARMPRSEVVSFELGKTKPLLAKPLTVTFRSGERWIFEVSAACKRGARSIAAVLA